MGSRELLECGKHQAAEPWVRGCAGGWDDAVITWDAGTGHQVRPGSPGKPHVFFTLRSRARGRCSAKTTFLTLFWVLFFYTPPESALRVFLAVRGPMKWNQHCLIYFAEVSTYHLRSKMDTYLGLPSKEWVRCHPFGMLLRPRRGGRGADLLNPPPKLKPPCAVIGHYFRAPGEGVRFYLGMCSYLALLFAAGLPCPCPIVVIYTVCFFCLKMTRQTKLSTNYLSVF